MHLQLRFTMRNVMKTIELNLEKNQNIESLSSLIKNKNIKVGRESFNLKVFISHSLNDTTYASFLLMLTKYLTKLMEESEDDRSIDLIGLDKMSESIYIFYFKNFDTDKLENKIEKDFKLKIELEKKNPLDDVYGIWSKENITLEQIRQNAWQRDN